MSLGPCNSQLEGISGRARKRVEQVAPKGLGERLRSWWEAEVEGKGQREGWSVGAPIREAAPVEEISKRCLGFHFRAMHFYYFPNLQQTSDRHMWLVPMEPRTKQGRGLIVYHIRADMRQGRQKDHMGGNGGKLRLSQLRNSEREKPPACAWSQFI